jgi:UDPglucose 6-dehydrogenase
VAVIAVEEPLDGFANGAFHGRLVADALVLATEWNEFRAPDWTRVKRLLKRPAVFDGRNIYDPKKLRALGFQYWGIGRS